jgi:hypothetical protein
MLRLVHIDIYGPMIVQIRRVLEHFITYTNDCSRYGYICVMHQKSKAFEKFKEFWTEAEKQLDKYIMTY